MQYERFRRQFKRRGHKVNRSIFLILLFAIVALACIFKGQSKKEVFAEMAHTLLSPLFKLFHTLLENPRKLRMICVWDKVINVAQGYPTERKESSNSQLFPGRGGDYFCSAMLKNKCCISELTNQAGHANIYNTPLRCTSLSGRRRQINIERFGVISYFF